MGIIPQLMKLRTLMLCLFVAAVPYIDAPPVAGETPTVSPTTASQGTQASPTRSITGTVRDATGATVPGAVVLARVASRPEQQAVTGSDGRFSLDVPDAADVVLIVRMSGFAENQQRIPASGGRDLAIVLTPATLLEEITVTATKTEQRLGDVPASTNVLSAADIKSSPAVVADDVLRQLPTFSLFRRTSSLSSHPTAQGVSLRGIGPSGVSRTLVLTDDIQFNDTFGGWVYWTRVPLESTDRIEVVDGSGSSLYGNYAMGGVINIVSSRAVPRTLELKPQYGNLNSPKFDFFASDVWGKLGASVDGSMFDTEGFPIVAASERGLVDNKAAVNFANFNAKADYNANSQLNGFVRLGYFRENRDNGKASTINGTEEANNTRWTTVSGGVRTMLPDQSDLQARLFSDFETFYSNFLAVPAATPARSLGRISTDQNVPATAFGGSVQWNKAATSSHFFTAGTDWRWVDGESQENGFDATRGETVILKRASGGTQRSIGAFLQDVMTPAPHLTVTLSVRVDRWHNYNAHNLETNFPSGTPTVNNNPALPERTDTVASPRVAALYHLSDRVSVWGDATSGFRAPTLNELYRAFSVGAVRTLANPQLGPERLVGGEVGVNVAAARNLTVRATWYGNTISDPVANITIGTNLQQRQNLGSTRVNGLQTDVEYRLGATLRASAGYLYNRATVTEFAANPALVGNYLPQVPAHRGSFRIAYTNPKFANVAFGMQFIGNQFDDDQNVRVVPAAALSAAGYDTTNITPGLPGYGTADLTVSRTLSRNIDAFVGVQNLFDKQYFVGTLPTTIGSPRMANFGVRIRVSGR
jgi:outer membrane receptor protein involved in Fe transport